MSLPTCLIFSSVFMRAYTGLLYIKCNDAKHYGKGYDGGKQLIKSLQYLILTPNCVHVYEFWTSWKNLLQHFMRVDDRVDAASIHAIEMYHRSIEPLNI